MNGVIFVSNFAKNSPDFILRFGLRLNCIVFVLGQGLPKTILRGYLLKMEESAKVYDTFSACYTFFKHRNMYSKFSSLFLRLVIPRIFLDKNIERNSLYKTNL